MVFQIWAAISAVTNTHIINSLHSLWVYLINAEIKRLQLLFKRILPHQKKLYSVRMYEGK